MVKYTVFFAISVISLCLISVIGNIAESCLHNFIITDTHDEEELTHCLQEYSLSNTVAEASIGSPRFSTLTDNFCEINAKTSMSSYINFSELHIVWQEYIKELIHHLTIDCRYVHRYNAMTPKWRPQLYQWTESLSTNVVDEKYTTLRKSKFWKKFKCPFYILAGAPKKYILPRNDNIVVSAKVVDAVTFINILSYTMDNYMGDFVSKIVEFGPGTGTLALSLFKSGYNGKYIGYDMYPMSTFQEYILRLSGVPAFHLPAWYIGTDFPSKVVLLTNKLEQLKAFDCGNDGIFYATYSLSESPNQLKNKILESVISCSHYFIVFSGGNKKGRWGNNFNYFRMAISDKLFGENVNYCMWRFKDDTSGILTVSKVLTPKCVEEAFCTKRSLVACGSSN